MRCADNLSGRLALSRSPRDYLHRIATMVNRLLATLLLLLLTGGLSTTTVAQSQSEAAEVRQFLEQRDQEIKSLLGNKKTLTAAEREDVKDVVNAGIDYEGMGRFALGTFWSDLTPNQREEFVQVFSEIVRAQSLSNLDVYRSDVSYQTVTVEGDSAYVVTSTVYKDVPTDVDYVLARTNGQWRVQDIILDDVSTAEGYARSFQTVIRKRGFDALMTSLHKKLDTMTS